MSDLSPLTAAEIEWLNRYFDAINKGKAKPKRPKGVRKYKQLRKVVRLEKQWRDEKRYAWDEYDRPRKLNL